MKTWEILRIIRSIDDERATKLLENLFMSGFISGVSRGYDNVHRLIATDIPVADDLIAGKAVFIKKHL